MGSGFIRNSGNQVVEAARGRADIIVPQPDISPFSDTELLYIDIFFTISYIVSSFLRAENVWAVLDGRNGLCRQHLGSLWAPHFWRGC